jgi:catabolite repression HPr-like protein
MIERKVVIGLSNGLQAKKAVEFVQKASYFISTISIKKSEKLIDAKSLMGVLAAALRFKEEVTLIVDGPDEYKTVELLTGYLTTKELNE